MSASNSGTFNGEVNADNVVVGTQHIINHYHAQGGVERDEQKLQAQITSYLKWVVGQYGQIYLRGIERPGGSPMITLKIDSIYVPLEATITVPPNDRGLKTLAGKALRRLKGQTEPEDMLRSETFEVGLGDVAKLGNRLVIVGGPGSGKTTVLLHMAWALAASLLDRNNAAAESRLGMTGDLPLPILVPLSSFNVHRRGILPGAPADAATLGAFISRHLVASDAGIDLPTDFFSRLLQAGQGVMLLLDGLDEVANEDERALVTGAVERLVAGKDALRTIVTCRTAAYSSPRTALGASFHHITVKPLDFDKHITPLVRQAYGCIYDFDLGEAKRRSDSLLTEITKLEAARQAAGGESEQLINSPLMVRLLIIVERNERHLPDERAKLFEKAIDALIRVDFHIDERVAQILAGNWETRRDILQELAFHMHALGADQGREIEEASLKRVLTGDPEFAPHVRDLIEHARNRGGLLEERDGSYRFFHLAFQEFLAARYLREVVGGGGLDAIVAFLADGKLTDPWWREPTLLLIGYLAAHSAKSARDFMRKLGNAGLNPDEKLAASELAAVGALEWKESGEALRRELADRIVALYDNLPLMSGAKPILRARAGRALGRLGDPRDFVTAVDAMRLCLVPRGRFYMGSPEDDKRSRSDERPATPDYLIDYDYAIGQHPVTNAQYADFARDGYELPEWWKAAQTAGCWENGHVIRQLLVSEDARTGDASIRFRFEPELAVAPFDFGEKHCLPNLPVVGISWYEALAFCAWLEARWTKAGWLGKDQRVWLPSEPEWEKAARGGDQAPVSEPHVSDAKGFSSSRASSARFKAVAAGQRQYPYGDKPEPNRANYDETKLASTSPVGCFPNGVSLYGCQEMTGNVWEWTRSAYGPWKRKDGHVNVEMKYGYPYRLEDGREGQADDPRMSRTLRGGSFNLEDKNARCACRFSLEPDLRGNGVGFRVVVFTSFQSP